MIAWFFNNSLKLLLENSNLLIRRYMQILISYLYFWSTVIALDMYVSIRKIIINYLFTDCYLLIYLPMLFSNYQCCLFIYQCYLRICSNGIYGFAPMLFTDLLQCYLLISTNVIYWFAEDSVVNWFVRSPRVSNGSWNILFLNPCTHGFDSKEIYEHLFPPSAIFKLD